MYIQNFVKTGQLVQKLQWGQHKQHGHFRGLILSLRKEIILKIFMTHN
jgi:hypothetical protein